MKYKIRDAFAIPAEGCGCEDPCSTHCTIADNVTYIGPNLQCTNVRTNDNLTLVLQKIDEKICKLFDLYYSLTTTSTSTTTIFPICQIIGVAIKYNSQL